ncbi:MAG: DUF4835 family protein [Bacteroidales bacterium]|jgi:hypothetical protein|nr:DUF4835 family protein [Bacteroidales bacterium]
MKKIILFLIILFFGFNILAQELDCRIQINYSSIQGTSNEKLFQAMQQSLYEFINNTKWTNNVYSKDEKIECNISIIVSEQISSDEFKGSIQITTSRPVYATSYLSPMLNYRDQEFQFKYNEFEPLEFNQNTFTDNLTSVLAYYIYIIIGFDYDSFAHFGGTPYFQKAEKIVQNAQSAQEAGWKSYESTKNRYWITENLLGEQYSQLREFNYTYHRLGMDKLADKPTEARAAIEQAVENLRNVQRRRANSILTTLILTVKSDEIVNIFSDAFSDEKARVANMMKETDPANSSKYDGILRESKTE